MDKGIKYTRVVGLPRGQVSTEYFQKTASQHQIRGQQRSMPSQKEHNMGIMKKKMETAGITGLYGGI